jgi:tRNA-Thr(GGU) m(6)t(6)A37 methyltransferase TsaA
MTAQNRKYSTRRSSAKHTIRPIGRLRSTFINAASAPKQGNEGAPDADLIIDPDVAPGLAGLKPGDEILVLTWLHQAARDVLNVHPRDNPSAPLTGVFATRSADRPNPIGLHHVTIRSIHGASLRIGPIEAVDGTPIVDLKPLIAVPSAAD